MDITAPDTTTDTVDALKAQLAAAQKKLLEAENRLAAANDRLSGNDTLIAHLKLVIARMQRERYGVRSERSARLLNQLELQLEELETSVTEDDLAAEKAGTRTVSVSSFTRKKPARKPFPDHLPRERVVVPGPSSCACCGGTRLAKLGEDVTETLEVIPRQWKVIQHVRVKFTCRDCESISRSDNVLCNPRS